MSTDDRRAAQEVARSAISDDVLAKLQTNPDHATYILLSSMDAGVDALLAAGYRLASDDESTVERVAKAMTNAGEEVDLWAAVSEKAREFYRCPEGGPVSESSEPLPPTWDVTVAVPLSLPPEMLDSLFNTVVDAVRAWEPKDRKGWDVSISGHPGYFDVIDSQQRRIDAALEAVDSMISQLVSGPELDDAHAIRSALKGTPNA
jgi:hypothetical protein